MGDRSFESLAPLVTMPTFMFAVPSTPRMNELFGVKNTFGKWLEVEAALARAEAELGIITEEAAREIGRNAKGDLVSVARLKTELMRTNHPIVALTNVLRQMCRPRSLGEYVHYGVTTQDIIDTGFALQLRAASVIYIDEARSILRILLRMAKKHKRTLMVARTHHVQAAPTTFGFIVSGWAWEIARDLKRLERMKEEVSVGNISGAVGTFSAFGDKGERVQEKTLGYLGLQPPQIPWHSSRDVWTEYATALAIVASTLGRIANEIMTLQKTEIGELEEPRQATDVSSSAMPHKRNPIHSETTLSVWNLCCDYADLVMRGMVIVNERDDTAWGNQLIGLRGLCMGLGWMLERSRTTLAGLVVNVKKMKENLDAAGTSIYSEFLVAKLGEEIGPRKTHDILHHAFMKAESQKGKYDEAFWEELESAKLPRSKVEKWKDPNRAIGLAVEITEKTVSQLSPVARGSV